MMRVLYLFASNLFCCKFLFLVNFIIHVNGSQYLVNI